MNPFFTVSTVFVYFFQSSFSSFCTPCSIFFLLSPFWLVKKNCIRTFVFQITLHLHAVCPLHKISIFFILFCCCFALFRTSHLNSSLCIDMSQAKDIIIISCRMLWGTEHKTVKCELPAVLVVCCYFVWLQLLLIPYFNILLTNNNHIRWMNGWGEKWGAGGCKLQEWRS